MVKNNRISQRYFWTRWTCCIGPRPACLEGPRQWEEGVSITWERRNREESFRPQIDNQSPYIQSSPDVISAALARITGKSVAIRERISLKGAWPASTPLVGLFHDRPDQMRWKNQCIIVSIGRLLFNWPEDSLYNAIHANGHIMFFYCLHGKPCCIWWSLFTLKSRRHTRHSQHMN